MSAPPGSHYLMLGGYMLSGATGLALVIGFVSNLTSGGAVTFAGIIGFILSLVAVAGAFLIGLAGQQMKQGSTPLMLPPTQNAIAPPSESPYYQRPSSG